MQALHPRQPQYLVHPRQPLGLLPSKESVQECPQCFAEECVERVECVESRHSFLCDRSRGGGRQEREEEQPQSRPSFLPFSSTLSPKYVCGEEAVGVVDQHGGELAAHRLLLLPRSHHHPPYCAPKPPEPETPHCAPEAVWPHCAPSRLRRAHRRWRAAAASLPSPPSSLLLQVPLVAPRLAPFSS